VSGDLEAGVTALSEAVKISPRDPGLAMWATILTLGSGYSGDMEGAEKWAALACKTDPHFFPALVLRAWIQSTQGKIESAQTLYNEARRLHPQLDEDYIIEFMGKGPLEQMQNAGLQIANT
jgi:Tfp pilus assembly protein PilF